MIATTVEQVDTKTRRINSQAARDAHQASIKDPTVKVIAMFVHMVNIKGEIMLLGVVAASLASTLIRINKLFAKVVPRGGSNLAPTHLVVQNVLQDFIK